MNLKEANLYDYPIWYKLYSARAAYQMSSLRPQDWDQFINEITAKEDLFNLYYKYVFEHISRAVTALYAFLHLICLTLY